MTIPSPNIKIGCIGGCINFTFGVPKNAIYYRLIKAEIPSIEIETALYLNYSSLIDTSTAFLNENDIDVLFLFVRHFPYMVLNKPWTKVINENGKPKYSLHPYLINKKTKIWPKELDAHQSKSTNIPIPNRNYFGLRDINAMLGKIMGLHQWAFQFLDNTIEELNAYCISNKVKLIVVGPTRNPETYMGDSICKNLNSLLSTSMALREIDYVDINIYHDCSGNPIFQADKIHFNAFGHQYLFDKIIVKVHDALANAQTPNSDKKDLKFQ